jgi:hypothetical protein
MAAASPSALAPPARPVRPGGMLTAPLNVAPLVVR